MRIAYGSDVGRKRAKNEDSVGNFKNRSNVVFVILADGLGGYQGGEVASEMAVSHLGYLFEQTELNNSNDAKAIETISRSRRNGDDRCLCHVF